MRQRPETPVVLQPVIPAACPVEEEIIAQDDDPRQPGHGEGGQQDEDVLGGLGEAGGGGEGAQD